MGATFKPFPAPPTVTVIASASAITPSLRDTAPFVVVKEMPPAAYKEASLVFALFPSPSKFLATKSPVACVIVKSFPVPVI